MVFCIQEVKVMYSDPNFLLYLKEVAKVQTFTKEQEIACAKRIEAGDEEALKDMVIHNLRLVISEAKKFLSPGFTILDFVGEGNIGLLTAARKYRLSFACKFSTYAVPWIRHFMRRFKSKNSRESILDEGMLYASERGSYFDDKIFDCFLAEKFKEIMSGLSERERTVLNHAFGLSGVETKNNTELGKIYSLSRERIRQIKESAIEKIRECGMVNSLI